MHHPYPEFVINKPNLNEENVLQPNNLVNLQNHLQTFPQQPQFNKYFNNIGANANQFHHANDLQQLTHNIHLNQQTQPQECTLHIHNPNQLYTQHPNQLQPPNLICTAADQQTQPQQQANTITVQQAQPLQLLIDDQSDLNTTDINMDSSPCSESASDLNRQFNLRSHKDGKLIAFEIC